MTNFLKFSMLAIFLTFGFEGVAQDENATETGSPNANVKTAARNYSQFDFSISLESLRGGAHDKSGLNEYYFKPSIYAIVNTLEERQKEFKDQRKIDRSMEEFANIQIASLDQWKANPKEGKVEEISVSGTTIREMVAEIMHTHGVLEAEVSVLVVLEMWEKEKKFIFFGEDVKVSETKFFPIPPTSFDTPARTNLALEMKDDKGVEVVFRVIYENPVESAKR